jgi:hypothetical protein
VLYFTDLDDEISFAIHDKFGPSQKILPIMTQIYGKEFEAINDDWADGYYFENDTLIIKSNFFNDDVLELLEEGVDIHIVP